MRSLIHIMKKSSSDYHLKNARQPRRDLKKTKVGIFMPCYNMGDFIDESLESLLNQTFQDFHVIIADDASPLKSTRQKLAEINHPRITVHFEKNNMGLVKISNKYMTMLDAEYIMLFSPDDKMHPDFIQEQVDYLEKHPSVQAVCTWVQEFGDGSDIIKYDDSLCTLPDMLVENHFSGAALMRKSAWVGAGKHDTNKDLYPNLDYDLWISMLERGYTLGTIAKPLFYWRVLHSSLSHSVDPENILVFRQALLKKYSSLYKQYSTYVIGYYFQQLRNFEEYYALSEKGHSWLDAQYKSLLEINESLMKENHTLEQKLNNTLDHKYLQPLYHKLKRFIAKF